MQMVIRRSLLSKNCSSKATRKSCSFQRTHLRQSSTHTRRETCTCCRPSLTPLEEWRSVGVCSARIAAQKLTDNPVLPKALSGSQVPIREERRAIIVELH